MAFLCDSVIQHGCNAGAVADDIDYGPYTSDQWARLFKSLFTSDQPATQGVLRGYANEFLVSGAGVAVTVQTGAGLCNGHFLIGEGAPAWTVNVVPPTAAHTRCDYVVMLENNTAGVYAPGVATMECPGTADYGGIADQVPEYACRLAVIKGAEDAACPPGSLSQAVGLWMTPLASIEWNVTQTIETVTDLRYYIHEYDISTLVMNNRAGGVGGTPSSVVPQGWQLEDAVETFVYANWRVPEDFVRDLTVTAVVVPAALGNMFIGHLAYLAQTGEAWNTHLVQTAAAAIAVVAANQYQEVVQLALTVAEVGDNIGVRFERDAGNILDTVDDDVWFSGFLFEYTAATPWS